MYACGQMVDYSVGKEGNSTAEHDYSTPFVVDPLRILIRKSSAQDRNSILDLCSIIAPASFFGLLFSTSLAAFRSSAPPSHLDALDLQHVSGKTDALTCARA